MALPLTTALSVSRTRQETVLQESVNARTGTQTRQTDVQTSTRLNAQRCATRPQLRFEAVRTKLTVPFVAQTRIETSKDVVSVTQGSVSIKSLVVSTMANVIPDV